MEASEFTELIPSLPHELGLDCLTRLPYLSHGVASGVCRRWRQLLLCREFYHHRKQSGHTHQLACLVQALSGGKISDDGPKPGESLSYGLTVCDPVGRVWSRIDPVPEYPNGLPLFCQLAGCEGKLVVMGGWDPVSYDPVCDVFVYEFAMQRWRKGKDMPMKMSFFAVGSHSGRVYVAGGHDENKNALRTGWVYDLRLDEWTELPQLSQERDECEGVVIGDGFWVVSGYGTENQGAFDGSADVYNFGLDQWRRVDGVWEPGRCPRSNVGVGKEGKLVNWSELDPAIRAGSCGIMLGNMVVVTGSEYQGAPHGFYRVEMGLGGSGKLEKMNVGDEFGGFVQSGCCVEI
ncbi:F-box/kelch-repeat protein At2g44130-like [Pistacia vera]|uniref:F-box/kelch-repeat protein At2g44130-like n=1 Tax=Pistacia vera TaxID=55513 RepID=UPI001263065F|nr:F-box/kelch-repeat protein At2g44130-like [Pistacia vera]XP_031269175.1 F-box/kelch-repeat protein At2g44130-like [Pistacia vera]